MMMQYYGVLEFNASARNKIFNFFYNFLKAKSKILVRNVKQIPAEVGGVLFQRQSCRPRNYRAFKIELRAAAIVFQKQAGAIYIYRGTTIVRLVRAISLKSQVTIAVLPNNNKPAQTTFNIYKAPVLPQRRVLNIGKVDLLVYANVRNIIYPAVLIGTGQQKR